jgi:VanZ family protein
VPVLIWMGLIFAGSGDLLSDERTSRFIGPVLRWFVPGLSEAAERRVRLCLRKGMHMAEYAVLATLALRGLTGSRRVWPAFWGVRQAGGALLLCVVYAASDEIHQSFVASRYGSPADVAIDTAGAVLGLAVTRRVLRTRRGPAQRTDAARAEEAGA